MKNTKHLLALVIIALLFISCDKDYNTIGAGLIDEVHFNVKDTLSIIKTDNVKFDNLTHPVQTDNLLYNVFGFYNDPVYGTTTANVLSQVALSEYGHDFNQNPVITKVVLSVPYFSNEISTSENGTVEYELDSVYGNTEINLKMYRSDYFLHDFDPSTNFEERQKYYSNENNTTLPGIEDYMIFEKNNFLPLAEEVSFIELNDEGEPETIRLSPRLRDDSSDADTNLDINDFNWLLDPANEEALSTASNFKNYYRGIYFKATPVNAPNGVLLGLDLSQAEIEVFYDAEKLLYTTDDDGNQIPLDENGDLIQDFEAVSTSIKILFSGNKVNLFDNSLAFPADTDKIYLKGGEGAMATIDLFGDDNDNNGVADELEYFRSQDWLINEANIEFYVDQSTVQGGDSEPDRIFLYDIDNEKVLYDYLFDNTTGSGAIDSQLNHLGKLERDDSGNGIKYKIRITEHITDVIKNDSTNIRLGLVVSNDVTKLGSSTVKDSGTSHPKSILSSSVVSHRGTVLFNETTTDEDKKLKFKIHYTKEDNN